MPRTPESPSLNPLKALDESKYEAQRYQYPIDIEKHTHAMIFYINETTTSSSVDDLSTRDEKLNKNGQRLARRGDFFNTRIGEIMADAARLPAGAAEVVGDKLSIVDGKPLTELVKKAITGRKTKRITTNIALYVPETLVYDYDQNYDTPSMVDYAQSVVGSIPLVGAKIAGAIGLIRKAAPLTGYSINPIIEVLYNAPELRTFQFDFTFAPRSSQEKDHVMQIIKEFRIHQAPEVTQNGMFFKPPSEFDILFRYRDRNDNFSENPNLPRISTCVLKTMNINYSPQNQFVTFHDGAPVEIQLRLVFQETELITRDLITTYGF
jgi:hypothetical protein